ncbi:GDSL esterase/lipase EXL3-like [Salvia hispanica]|uniref:GDSL esterase/lipase EXL3-like n=1 Tax=Salvia hispanica TaxID=49212 RepID=UPI002008F69C|nr:GDSL esterase/lipase EXL3-like [Salvia hispanica]
MRRNSNSWSLFGVITVYAMMSCCEGRIVLPPNVTVPAVFAFGDSIVDQGANNHVATLIKCNFQPYGKDLHGFGPTGRFSNGKTPPDFIASELGVRELIPAYLDSNLTPEDLVTGVSFASGGCGYDPQTAQIVLAISLSQQLDQFREYIGKLKAAVGEEKAKFILENSLFLVVAGSDDLANTYFTLGIRRAQYDVNSYADLMVSSACNFIEDIYRLGARRIAVFGAPPIGCLPAQRTLKGGISRFCSEEQNEAAQLVNSKLAPALASIRQRLPQSRPVYINIYDPLLDLIQHPYNHGFEVSDKGCCGSGAIEVVLLCNRWSRMCRDDSKYVFWDSYHPTESAYKIIVDQLLQESVKYFE